jgi:hypothetical protein
LWTRSCPLWRRAARTGCGSSSSTPSLPRSWTLATRSGGCSFASHRALHINQPCLTSFVCLLLLLRPCQGVAGGPGYGQQACGLLPGGHVPRPHLRLLQAAVHGQCASPPRCTFACTRLVAPLTRAAVVPRPCLADAHQALVGPLGVMRAQHAAWWCTEGAARRTRRDCCCRGGCRGWRRRVVYALGRWHVCRGEQQDSRRRSSTEPVGPRYLSLPLPLPLCVGPS